MNKVILLGNIGMDGELKVLSGGQAVLNLRIATSETWKDKDSGEKKEATEWHTVELWGSRAEALAPHMTKGKKVLIEGSIHTRSYEKNGEKRYATSVKATNIEFAGGPKGSDSSPSPTSEPGSDADQEIPF